MLKINSCIKSNHIEAEDLKNHIGESVTFHGSIYKIRSMSDFAFVLIMAKRMIVQCVWSVEFSKIPLNALAPNMCVSVNGDVVAEPRSRVGYEVRITDIKILSHGTSETPLVINGKEIDASLETILDYRPVSMRNECQRAIFKLQEGITRGFRAFLYKNRFTEIHTPKIVFSGAEGGANIFKLNYFEKEAYLTQSPQFYKQMMVGVFERVFEIAPVFRAEKHDTSRHLNEYTSVDFEMGYIESFYDIMQMETAMIIENLEYLKEEYAQEIALLNVKMPKVSEIPAIKFLEAKELISKKYNREITDIYDFEPEEEKLLGEIIKKETGSDFVFVTHYLSKKRPFYAMDSAENTELTDSFDLLFRGMEVTTGGQRINDYNMQVEKMRRRGMNVDLFASYLMAHKCGLAPHGGLGLGLERFTARLLEFNNVRSATMFPRDINRLEP